MNIRHPTLEARVSIMGGQYAGRTGKVSRIFPDHGAPGFAEIAFDGAGKAKDCDLVPMQYVDRSRVRQC
ncbi:hypothetical protein [Paraburkholderia sp. A1RO-5L]|uniref:hypothetical protein n=1 Tax=unclassified Paraburkholderia TaxID=2615204 RepID=UPI003B78A835